MALLDVVFRLLDKAGTGFLEPRREDGHGSALDKLSHNHPHNTLDDPLYEYVTNWPEQIGLTDIQLRATPVPVSGSVSVSNLPLIQTVQGTVSLDEASLIALENVTVNVEAGASVGVNNFPATFPLPAEQVGLTNSQLRASAVPTSDDYQTGEILADQIGAGAVLTFTFSAPVQNIWVYAINPADLTESGEVRVDPFGGTPSGSFGIPVPFGGGFPIAVTGTVIKVFAPADIRVTLYGNRRG